MSIPSDVLSELEVKTTMWNKDDWIEMIRHLSSEYDVDIDAKLLDLLDNTVPGSGSKNEMLYAIGYFGVSRSARSG